jgi:hypothetical protein
MRMCVQVDGNCEDGLERISLRALCELLFSMDLNLRTKLLEEIQSQWDAVDSAPPVVTLDEYFLGNTDEECIAPNQVGYGRPALADVYARLQAIAQKPNVQAVLVGIHDEWQIVMDDPTAWPPAENVHIYTSATIEEVEQWIEGLAADGVGEGWPYRVPPAAPPVAPGMKVLTVYWD